MSTTPLEAMESLAAKMRARETLPEIPPKCGKCRDSGWWEIRHDGHGEVIRCPNGCEPPRKHGNAPIEADLPMIQGRVIT